MATVSLATGRLCHASNWGVVIEAAPKRDFFATLPFGIVLAVVGLALLAAAIFLLRKRRQQIKGRKGLRVFGYIAGSLALVIGLAAVANWYAGWMPNLEAARLRLGFGPANRDSSELAHRAPDVSELGSRPITDLGTSLAKPSPHPTGTPPARGAVKEFDLPAPKSLNLASPEVWIYTPPGYDPSGKTAYPVIYLIHGSPGSPSDWIAAGGADVFDQMIAAGELAPVIAVFPSVGARGAADSGCLDSTKPGGSQVETFLYQVVKPWVQNHFPVAADRRANAIGGMSMGGYCAIDQGLRHSDQFATVLAWMPYAKPGAAGKNMKSNQAEIDAVTPSQYISTIETIDHNPVAAWFAIPGNEEQGEVGRDSHAMAQALTDRGQSTRTLVATGQNHTWKMAIATMQRGLAFWQEQLDRIP
ncbi:MAG: LPXTG cell wall anchor domain-containing protein [Bifidobacteriaceae bacterium]|nr:LPXTG cell wall anchor domain-containing protein [Bifidobacteriaceae bacterium]